MLFGYPPAYAVAPLCLLAVMAVKQWPDLCRDWQGTSNKRELILNRWIRDRNARL